VFRRDRSRGVAGPGADQSKDKKVRALVKAFLKAGVMTRTGDRKDTPTGTPQGGILSPLLANIALTVLDEHSVRAWTAMGDGNQRRRRRTRGEATYRLVRYADAFIIVVKGGRHHGQALDEVAQVIAPMGLRLAPDKTRVVHIDDGFDFLGHTIVRRVKRGTSKAYVFTFPSAKAMRSVRDRTRELTKSRSTLYLDLDELLLRLNRSLQGWANYFRHGSSSRHFQQIDYHAWKRVGAWICRKHHPISWAEVRRRRPGRLPPRREASPGPDHGSPTTGHLPRRLQRQDRPVSSSRHEDTDPMGHQPGHHAGLLG
jgi:RNA-directed DNA polymerase